jgi:hypothetical protein
MPRGKGIYDDENADEAKAEGQDRDGDATAQDTPDVAETDQEPTG